MTSGRRSVGVKSMTVATILVMVGLVFSKASGFLRDIFVGIKFSDPVFRDSFTLAFTIPDLVYNLLIGGSIQSAITPSLSASIAAGEEEKGIRAVSTFISFMALLLITVCTFATVFSVPLYQVFNNGSANEETTYLAAMASKWLFPQIIFMMLAALCIGILNAYKRFASTAFGPTIYNIFVLLSIIFFAGNSKSMLMHTTCGIMGAAAIYFLFQYIVGLDKLRKFRFIWAPRDKDFHALVKRALPILVSASVVQINMAILNAFALTLPDDGYVYALRNASTTWQLPYGIFAAAIGNVMLPSLAELYGKNDFEGAAGLLSTRLRKALFLTIPSAVIMFLLSNSVISAIFQWNSYYTDSDAAKAGMLLQGYCIAIISHTVVFIMNQAFYAIGKTKIPLVAGCIGLISNPLICYFGIPYFSTYALTLSYSVTSILQMLILCAVYFRNKKLRPHGLLRFISKEVLIVIVMSVVLIIFMQIYPTPEAGKIMRLSNLAIKVLVGLAVYLGAAKLLRMDEADEWWVAIRNKLFKSE